MNKPPSRINHSANGMEIRLASQDGFPTVRYFQTHFVFLGETLTAMNRDLAILKERLDRLEQILEPEPGGREMMPKRFEQHRDS